MLLLTCEVCHILRYPAQRLELLGDDFSHLLVSVGLYFPEAIAGLPSKSYTLSLFYFGQHMYKDKKFLDNNKIAYMIYVVILASKEKHLKPQPSQKKGKK